MKTDGINDLWDYNIDRGKLEKETSFSNLVLILLSCKNKNNIHCIPKKKRKVNCKTKIGIL